MKVTLYIAQSLDGYVASKNGSVSWLDEFSNTGEDYGYKSFIDSVDTVTQGYTTYKQFEDKHAGKNSYVFTNDLDREVVDGVTFVKGSTKKFIDGLDKNTHKHVWLVGGPNLLAAFLNENQVDELVLFTMPVFLRDGIPLFGNLKTAPTVSLLSTKKYINGVVELHYAVKK